MLKSTGIKIAVITNSPLLRDKEVRNDLEKADWVSVKIDTVDEKLWHKIDRPNGKLKLGETISGLKTFVSSFKGILVTKTMLVKRMMIMLNRLKKLLIQFSKSTRIGHIYWYQSVRLRCLLLSCLRKKI